MPHGRLAAVVTGPRQLGVANGRAEIVEQPRHPPRLLHAHPAAHRAIPLAVHDPDGNVGQVLREQRRGTSAPRWLLPRPHLEGQATRLLPEAVVGVSAERRPGREQVRVVREEVPGRGAAHRGACDRDPARIDLVPGGDERDRFEDVDLAVVLVDAARTAARRAEDDARAVGRARHAGDLLGQRDGGAKVGDCARADLEQEWLRAGRVVRRADSERMGEAVDRRDELEDAALRRRAHEARW